MSAYFKNYNIVQNTAHYFVFSKICKSSFLVAKYKYKWVLLLSPKIILFKIPKLEDLLLKNWTI